MADPNDATAILLIPGKHDAPPAWVMRLAQRKAGDKPLRAEMIPTEDVARMVHPDKKDGVVIRDPGWSGISFWC